MQGQAKMGWGAGETAGPGWGAAMRGHSRALPDLPWEPVVQEGAGAAGERCRGEASPGAARVRGWLWKGPGSSGGHGGTRETELGWAGQDESPEGLGQTVAAVM